MSDNLVGLATKERRPNLHYDLVNPDTGVVYKCSSKGWRYSRETMAQKIAEKRIIWPPWPTGRPRHKKFLSDLDSDFTGFSSIVDCGNTNEGTEEVQAILGSANFIFPKPRSLVQRLVEQVACAHGDIVLDSFAGSGTTGHAVLQLNKQDGINRRFILVEMDSTICRSVTSERLRRVCIGYTRPDGRAVEGLSGGFRFSALGEPLFDAEGNIRNAVRFLDLARHVYFIETGEPLTQPKKVAGPLIGVCGEKAVYLLYNGVLNDKSPGSGNVLTTSVLTHLPKHRGLRIIYGTACRLGSERLRREGIFFKQLPYSLKVDAR